MPRLRRGVTLVELLVVLAIIGILVSLLMPAVQSARVAHAGPCGPRDPPPSRNCRAAHVSVGGGVLSAGRGWA